MGNKIGFLSADRLDEMESIPRQSSQGEIGSMALIGFGESSKAESIRDHKGIDGVGLVQIGVGFFEVADELRIKLIDRGVEGSQNLAGGQEVDQMKIKERGGFGGDLEGRKSFILEELEEMRFKGFCSGERIGEGWRSHLFSLLIHEADGIGFRAHITTNEECFWQGVHPLSFWIGVVKRGL
jgi:hypothetical protein